MEWAPLPSSPRVEILAAFSPVLGTNPKCFLQHPPTTRNTFFLWSNEEWDGYTTRDPPHDSEVCVGRGCLDLQPGTYSSVDCSGQTLLSPLACCPNLLLLSVHDTCFSPLAAWLLASVPVLRAEKHHTCVPERHRCARATHTVYHLPESWRKAGLGWDPRERQSVA